MKYAAQITINSALIILSALFFLGCKHEDLRPVPDPNILINSNTADFTGRTSLSGAGVVSIMEASGPSDRIKKFDGRGVKIPLIKVSQVTSPSIERLGLTATHVDISDGFAYVSYNTPGEEYGGAIEIFDVSNPLKPTIVSQAYFRHANINSIKYSNGIVYAAAAFDIDRERNMKYPAHLVYAKVSNGYFISDFEKIGVSGFAAVDLDIFDNKVAVASGSNGEISILEKSGQPVSSIPIPDIRSVIFGNGVIGVFTGKNGIKLYDPNSYRLLSNIFVEQATDESKRIMDMGPGTLFTPEGSEGMGVYSIQSGAMMQRIPIPLNPVGVADEDIVTNAVSYDEGYVYMANGGAGISITVQSDFDVIESVGVLDIPGSSNYVKANDGYIFVASGRKGLQILSLASPEEIAIHPALPCNGFQSYDGESSLAVEKEEVKGYFGPASLRNLSIEGVFSFCGALAVAENILVREDAYFSVNGRLVFGQYNRNSELRIEKDAVLKISGSMVIYGDLVLEDDATLEFIGETNFVTIFGTIKKGSGTQILGEFIDTENKL